MADFPFHRNDAEHGPIMREFPGRASGAYTRGPQQRGTPSFATEALQDPPTAPDFVSVPYRPAVSPTDYPVVEVDQSTPGIDWFEKIHIIPKVFAFGSILTLIQKPFELYSAYRVGDVTLQTFTNTVDPGVTIPDLPGLPHVLGPQSGLNLTIEVDPIGAVSFAGDLLFTFDVQVVPLPISGERLILWPFAPERPVTEFLGFLTEIISKRTGTEDRIAQRKRPRQEFDLLYHLTGKERRQALLRMMDWQGRAFGLPLQETAVAMTAPAAATATVNVYTTLYTDFRVGGLAAVLADSDTFDVLQIQSMTATSITFTTNLQNSYPAGTMVHAVRIAEMAQTNSGDRHPVNLELISIRWDVQDNDVDLASTAGFSSYNGKVLFDDDNFVRGTMPETFAFRVYDVDNLTGVSERSRIWEQNKRFPRKTFFADTRQRAWEIRQVLYALKGRQKSFYIATKADDLLVTDPLSATSNKMDIENNGYTRFAQNRTPKRDFRITFTDGSSLDRVIISSQEVDAATERLSLDAVWPTTRQPSEVRRVQFLELMRFDTDRFRIEHARIGQIRVEAPVAAIFETA